MSTDNKMQIKQHAENFESEKDNSIQLSIAATTEDTPLIEQVPHHEQQHAWATFCEQAFALCMKVLIISSSLHEDKPMPGCDCLLNSNTFRDEIKDWLPVWAILHLVVICFYVAITLKPNYQWDNIKAKEYFYVTLIGSDYICFMAIMVLSFRIYVSHGAKVEAYIILAELLAVVLFDMWRIHLKKNATDYASIWRLLWLTNYAGCVFLCATAITMVIGFVAINKDTFINSRITITPACHSYPDLESIAKMMYGCTTSLLSVIGADGLVEVYVLGNCTDSSYNGGYRRLQCFTSE